jgi:putative ABC transport system permease protein
MLRHLLNDVRYAARRLSASPSFTAAAVITIALGVGINTGLFSVLNGIALRDLPAPDAGELVSIHQTWAPGAAVRFTAEEYRAYRDGTETLSGILAYSDGTTVTLGGDAPREITGTLVSCNYFEVLRHAPVLGPGLPSDCDTEGAMPTVVLGHDLWTTEFAADTGIVGREVQLNRQAFVVAGVAPEGMRGVDMMPVQFFAPLAAQPILDPEPLLFLSGGSLRWLVLLGRLADGASLGQVRAELGVIAARIDEAQRPPPRATTLAIDRARRLSDPGDRGETIAVGAVVMAAFGLVLLIACANVANLLLARATGRAREIAVRLSLGASRSRIVQQLLAESLLLAIAGGVLGSVLALWSVQSLLFLAIDALPPQYPEMAIDATPDARVLAFALLASIGSAVVFGLAPALQASKPDLHAAMKVDVTGMDRRSGARLRGTLVGLQVAVCMVLMIAAGLLLRGLATTQNVDPGFDYENVAVASFDLTAAGYDTARAAVFQRQLAERVDALPGVDVAHTTLPPLYPGNFLMAARLGGQDQFFPLYYNDVSPTYFSLTGIPIVRGRAFTEADTAEGSRTIIVTEATARRFWPGLDPIGQTIEFPVSSSETVSREVVGIARDTQIKRIGEVPSVYAYLPPTTNSQPRLQLLAKSDVGFAATASSIRDIARELDPALVVRVEPLEANLDLWRSLASLSSMLATALGALALVLAAVGIYGVVAYSVGRRAREIGIRIALGANARSVVSLMLKRTMRPVVIGAAVGLAAAMGVSQVLSSVLFGVSPVDPVALISAGVVVAGVAFAAGTLPARRAARVDPSRTLHYE